MTFYLGEVERKENVRVGVVVAMLNIVLMVKVIFGGLMVKVTFEQRPGEGGKEPCGH